MNCSPFERLLVNFTFGAFIGWAVLACIAVLAALAQVIPS